LGNTFEAGVWSTNLKIDVDDLWYDDEAPPGGPIVDGPFELFGELEDIKPSHNGQERCSIHIETYGDTEDLYILLRDIDETGEYTSLENGIIGPEQAAGDVTPLDGELDEYLELKFELEEVVDGGPDIITEIWTGYPSELTYDSGADGYFIPGTPVSIDPTKDYFVRVHWHFDENKPGINICQGDTFSCTVVFATGWTP
jgi:hypothetical protein